MMGGKKPKLNSFKALPTVEFDEYEASEISNLI